MKRHGIGNNRQDSPQGLHCRGRVWIEKDGETYLGFGRIVLLERIREFGSISGAAKSMKMSYKHAWDLVASMNRHSSTPLVSASKGGKGGGGAHLTEAGERAVSEFTELRARLDTFLANETSRLQVID